MECINYQTRRAKNPTHTQRINIEYHWRVETYLVLVVRLRYRRRRCSWWTGSRRSRSCLRSGTRVGSGSLGIDGISSVVNVIAGGRGMRVPAWWRGSSVSRVVVVSRSHGGTGIAFVRSSSTSRSLGWRVGWRVTLAWRSTHACKYCW